MQTILRTAKENGVKSLAIPSLGVGNHKFPAQESARILCEEIIAFQARNRGKLEYYFVIYDETVYKKFKEVYEQKMDSAPQPKMVSIIILFVIFCEYCLLACMYLCIKDS